jgi:hypothetical protein
MRVRGVGVGVVVRRRLLLGDDTLVPGDVQRGTRRG